MKKLVLKTAIITLGVAIILAVAAFGVASLCVPAAMSDLTYSLGMPAISSDYAYQEYQRTGDLLYLSRSFELAATHGRDAKAEERFDLLYADEGFSQLCSRRDESAVPILINGQEFTIAYRDYACGLGACVKYRLAASDADEAEAIGLAVSETERDLPAGSPVFALAREAAEENDEAFCEELLDAVDAGGFEKGERYDQLVTILEVSR